MATCTSCNRVIIFARTEGGSRMPVDPDPHTDGNLVLVTVGDEWAAEGIPPGKVAIALTDDELADLKANHPERPRYVSHFATCPMASRHRRRNAHSTLLPLEEA